MSIDLAGKLNNFDVRTIDTQNASTVANQIFINASNKSINTAAFDLSKFKKNDLGLEIYTRQINTEKVKQIALRQTDFDVKLTQNFTANIKYLNAQAAININKDLSKNLMAGKVQTQVNHTETDNEREVFALPKSSDIFDINSLNKDKNGSDGSSYFQQNKKQEETNEEPSLNMII